MLAHDKASLLLVYGGLKPSAQVVMQGRPFGSTDDTIHIETSLIDTLSSILSELKLSHVNTVEIMEARTNDSSSMAQEVMRVYVAPSKRVALQLKAAFDNIQESHSNAGNLLGYPETAVKAFLTQDMLDWENHPTLTKDVSERNMRLLGHRLSKENWAEEVKYLESWGNFLKKISPSIYDEITKEL